MIQCDACQNGCIPETMCTFSARCTDDLHFCCVRCLKHWLLIVVPDVEDDGNTILDDNIKMARRLYSNPKTDQP